MITNEVEIAERNKRIAYRAERTHAVLHAGFMVRSIMANYHYHDARAANRIYRHRLLTATQFYKLTTS